MGDSGRTRTALLLGATGMVGSECLRILLEHRSYGTVRVLTRRPFNTVHEKLEGHHVDFGRLAEHRHLFRADDLFCALGTTIRTAGSQEAFRRVDLEFPLTAARLALENGARQVLIVTALGASSQSRIFYNRVKGEVEDQLKLLPLASLAIFQPSILVGHRSERRPGEELGIRIMTALSFAMVGPLRRLRPIAATTVARAMVSVALQSNSGIRVYRSDQIQQLGENAR